MTFLTILHEKLNQKHLLQHPFYQAWNDGSLSHEVLQTYAKEYYHHVAAFPRYLSGIHTLCADIKMRQILLGNLIEEESGEENHPELWQRFAEGLGVERAEMQESPQLQETKDLVEGYFNIVSTDFPSGLGALYAYERQTPAVAKSKIEGLKNFYNITDAGTLKFFTVHMEADEWHTAECATLIEKLTEDDQQKVLKGAEQGAALLWNFLDGMRVQHVC